MQQDGIAMRIASDQHDVRSVGMIFLHGFKAGAIQEADAPFPEGGALP
jgi:hypothetical protein